MPSLTRSSDNFLITESKGKLFGRNILANLPNPLGKIITTDYTIALDTLNITDIDSIVYKDTSLKIFVPPNNKNLKKVVDHINPAVNIDDGVKSFLKENLQEIIKKIKYNSNNSKVTYPEKDIEYILKKYNKDDTTADYNGVVVAKLTTMPKIYGITFYKANKNKVDYELKQKQKQKLEQNRSVNAHSNEIVETQRTQVIGDKNIIFEPIYDQSSGRIVFYIENKSQESIEYYAIVIALNNSMVFADFQDNTILFDTNSYNFIIYKPTDNVMNEVKKILYGITTFSNGGGKRNNKKSKKNSKNPLKRKNNKSRKFARK